MIVAAKGGGSENKSKFAMLLPNDNIVDWVLSVVPTMGADWCPPGLLSLGIGGTPEKAMLMAKWAMMEPFDIQDLIKRGPKNRYEELRLELYEKVNALGIGAQGLGGLTTVLDVKVSDYPTHAASKPVALLPNCAATRHAHFVLDGTGPAHLEAPSLDDWPKLALDFSTSQRVNVDTLTGRPRHVEGGRPLLLSGKILTGRDAAHKRLVEMMERGEKLPVDFTNRFIYYVGPVDAVRDEAVGPAGPTTCSRMDKFVEPMLGQAGLIGMVGKCERGPVAIESIRKHGAVYCIAVGGAAYLVSKAIRRLEGPGVRGPRHGSDLRVRGEGHAGHRRRRCRRQRGPQERAGGVAREDRQDPGRRRVGRGGKARGRPNGLLRRVLDRAPRRGRQARLRDHRSPRRTRSACATRSPGSTRRSRVHRLPDWEILPYDQFSPHPDLVSERLATLYQFAQRRLRRRARARHHGAAAPGAAQLPRRRAPSSCGRSRGSTSRRSRPSWPSRATPPSSR